ncbi:MAG: bifunctional adenosylcobinamide kinase/adenosylcobinamide-phosphate guanylyltransferase [Pelagimonas sp.]|jgi:adenosylcobinamide kinase/adenosylcobinamide-phosphate guanylyltransferase|nr:bifunctional adenosylcobinamide kinase/adenosylcobinamide-phosphate guanylyltransferase [Pelagimonas sp.]
MKKSILITGGARSGKSVFAEKMALSRSGRAVYIATAKAYDDEMRARIADHQARRGDQWTNLHAPFDLITALRDSDGGDPRLVDCLTLWLTNLMLNDRDWRSEGTGLAETLVSQTAPVIFVTNEVGAGIVPENKLARAFRDAAGWLNQTIAQASDEVYLCVAGYPVKVKPNDHTL